MLFDKRDRLVLFFFCRIEEILIALAWDWSTPTCFVVLFFLPFKGMNMSEMSYIFSSFRVSIFIGLEQTGFRI